MSDLIFDEYIRTTLPEEYPYVILVAGIIAFEVILVGLMGPGLAWVKILSKQFMEENFDRIIMDDPIM